MKYNLLLIAILSIFLLNSVNAEVFLWDNVIVDNSTDTVTQHGYYQFEDTSIDFIGRNKPIDVSILYTINELPYFLNVGFADYCNLTITHLSNNYDSDNKFINLTSIKTTLNFGTSVSQGGQLDFKLKDADSLITDLSCHHSANATLYQDNVLVGRFSALLPTFECKGCGDKSLQELSKETQTNLDIAEQQSQISLFFQQIIRKNYEIWTYISWIIKIGIIFISFLYVVFIGYWIYHYIIKMNKESRR